MGTLAEMPLLSNILKMFADDALLYKAIYNPMADFQDLQKDMLPPSFAQWIANHDLKLNVKKGSSLLLSMRWLPLCNHTSWSVANALRE